MWASCVHNTIAMVLQFQRGTMRDRDRQLELIELSLGIPLKAVIVQIVMMTYAA